MFKGNKSSLPVKPCEVCARPMSWRKAWEKNWESVKYCSERCRRSRPASAVARSGSASADENARGASRTAQTGRKPR